MTWTTATPVTETGGGWIAPPGDIVLDHSLGNTTFYRHGWHSWALAHWAIMDEPPVVVRDPERRRLSDDPLLATTSGHVGNYVGAISGPDGKVLLLGALGIDTTVEATENTLTGTSRGEPAGWFIAYGAEDEVFDAYAAELARHLAPVAADPGRVWCSW